MRSWVDFWNAEHSIYVSERHKRLHAQNIERDILRHVPAANGPPQAIMLDYGCGEAMYAGSLAPHCKQLILCDAAPRICEDLARRLAGVSQVRVVEPVGVEQLSSGSLDLIVVNSLLQYLSRADLEALFDLWRGKLKPSGHLVVADVIPPNVSPLRDAAALLWFAVRGRFLLAAMGGLVRTALSDYGRIRKQLGFATYSEREMLDLFAAHGLSAQRVHPNFGHNQARMTFSAKRAG